LVRSVELVGDAHRGAVELLDFIVSHLELGRKHS